MDRASDLGGRVLCAETPRRAQRLEPRHAVDPAKDVAYHLSSLDPYAHTTEDFARFVRERWSVEACHGKRDNAYLEDKTARRINPNLQTAMMLARTIGLWEATRHPERTTTEVVSGLYVNPRKGVRLFTKQGML